MGLEANDVKVQAGMTVAFVQSNGSNAQAKAIKLFDYNNDNQIQQDEADEFNKFDIFVKGNVLHLQNKELKKQVGGGDIFIQREQIPNNYDENLRVSSKGIWQQGNDVPFSVIGDSYKTIKYEERNTQEGYKSYLSVDKLENLPKIKEQPQIYVGHVNNLTVKNSSIDAIYAEGLDHNIYIYNTKDIGMVYNSATELYISPMYGAGVTLKHDEKSKLDIKTTTNINNYHNKNID